MRWLLFVALIVGGAADCSSTALSAAMDPNFSWLVSGNPDIQRTQLTLICTTPSAQAGFMTVFNNVRAQCITVGNDTTNPANMAFDLLEKVLCAQIDGIYCGLQLFALIDTGYLLKLHDAAAAQTVPELPKLEDILTNDARKNAICLSDTCASYLEQVTSAYSRQVLDAAGGLGTAGAGLVQGAIEFITKLVNRPRCGCFKDQGQTCYTAANVGLGGPNGLDLTKACDADGNLKNCARVKKGCENYPDVTCPSADKCNGYSGTVEFQVTNLLKDCFMTAMSVPGSAMKLIEADLEVNLRGTVKGDYDCTCDPPGNNGVAGEDTLHCVCQVDCVKVSSLQENDSVGKALKNGEKKTVVTNNLDLAVPKNCKKNQAIKTFGESVVFKVSLTDSGAESLSLGLSFLVCLFFAL